ncbi:hypothetical protein [Acetobacter aceti]|nr:hypothetical protein [Acetobacter aceti]
MMIKKPYKYIDDPLFFTKENGYWKDSTLEDELESFEYMKEHRFDLDLAFPELGDPLEGIENPTFDDYIDIMVKFSNELHYPKLRKRRKKLTPEL